MENLGNKNIVTEECFMADGDDLLNFSLPCEEDEDESTSTLKISSSSSYSSSHPLTTHPDDLCGSSFLPPGSFEEEELEWLSDKNAFPSVESFFGTPSDNPDNMGLDHQSPISVLENSTSSSNGHGSGYGSSIMSCCQSFLVPTSFPVRARSKRRRTRRKEGFSNLRRQHLLWWNRFSVKYKQQALALPPLPTTKTNSSPSIGRRCLHCGADKTPQWRVGPMGPKTLCNACGVRYKSGRLVPEYRPASSPTFSAAIHSNSHRKIIKMRKEKQQEAGIDGISGNDTCGYRV